MTQFKENLSTTSIIEPNQPKTIYDHKWSSGRDISASIVPENNPNFMYNTIRITDYHETLGSLYLNKDDAIAIAKHFSLLPVLSNYTPQEYLNGELVVNIDTGPDLEIGGAGGLGKFNGFMSEDRE